MNNSQIKPERTIRVSDLFLAVCQRWRSLIICLVIGALLLGAYGWWKNGNTSEIKDAKINALLEKIDDSRKGPIEAYASEYAAFVKQIAKQTEYNKNAPLMQLDPYHLNVHEVKYYIYNITEELVDNKQVTADFLAQAYIARMHKEYLGQRLEKGKEGETDVLLDEEGGLVNLIQIDTINIESGVLTFRICSKDSIPDKAPSELKEYVQSAYNYVQQSVGEHSLLLIGESSFITEDTNILKTQTSNLQRIEDLNTRLDTIQKNITNTDEKQYLNYLIQKELQEEKSGNIGKFFRRISKRHILLGAILGVFLAALVIVIKYIASGTIKTTKELEEDFGLQVLGKFEGKDPFYRKRKTRLDRWLRRIRNKRTDAVSDEEMSDLIATKIRLEAEKQDLQRICVIVDGKVFRKPDFIDDVLQKVGDKPFITVITNILEQSKDLEAISDMDGAVLVGQIGQSRFEEIQNICKLCANYQVEMIGSIVLD